MDKVECDCGMFPSVVMDLDGESAYACEVHAAILICSSPDYNVDEEATRRLRDAVLGKVA